MSRQRLDLSERDLTALANVMGTEAETLRTELDERPWFVNDVLRNADVAHAVLTGTGVGVVEISPLLFFAVVVHRAAEELSDSEWVADWVGPNSRLPVFDVEPLLEFSDAPGRLFFITRLLAGFAAPHASSVPADQFDLDDLVRWLPAAQPADRMELLRRLGDLALFQAGVFPDATAAKVLVASEAEHLGRSVGMGSDELLQLIDPASCTPGLDTLETLGSAWYQAAAAEPAGTTPPVMLDVAARIRPARRFLNHLADRYLSAAPVAWAPGW